jgi:hypothetical protein
VKDLQQGKIDLLLIHVAEGAPGDMESTTEFRALQGVGLLGPKTAIIHGVALGADEFLEMAKSGTALIWSPRSNFELYGFTADVAAAVNANLMVALAPDWSQLIVIRGSVLAEMEGMAPTVLDPGGFAMMPKHTKHEFSCKSNNECIMVVSFDGATTTTWGK